MKVKDLLKLHEITIAQYDSFTALQRKTLQTAKAKIDVTDVAFIALAGSKEAAASEPSIDTETKQDEEPSIDSLGANTTKRRGPAGPRVGDSMGAKPLVRKLLGTKAEDGTYPSLTLEELCSQTKKSDVNIRTILSDLRSAKYCGTGGVFMTKSIKADGITKYQFVEA